MANTPRLCWQSKHGASQVVLLRDRISIHRVDRVDSCELNERLTLCVIWRSELQNTPSVAQEGYPDVTYVPGLICHPCSRPHGGVRRRRIRCACA